MGTIVALELELSILDFEYGGFLLPDLSLSGNLVLEKDGREKLADSLGRPLFFDPRSFGFVFHHGFKRGHYRMESAHLGHPFFSAF